MTDLERYEAACHAMQSGVAATMDIQGRDPGTEPKHLRVGINSSMVEHSALVRLLMSKGIISNDEYLKALADGMEEEVKRYEADLYRKTGKQVRLM